LNFSILDGWWPEGYDGSNGWAIGGQDQNNIEDQNQYDANSFYRILENEIRPLFYNVDSEGMSAGWLEVIRNSIKSITPAFSARRMLKEYVKAYLP
ncbi:MAG: alpha-glucan phosphorylase, partial [Candidatus Hodarchaeota archaeon]